MAGTVLDCVRVINQDSPIWEVKYRQLRKEQHMREAEEKFAMKWWANKSVLRHSTLGWSFVFLMATTYSLGTFIYQFSMSRELSLEQ